MYQLISCREMLHSGSNTGCNDSSVVRQVIFNYLSAVNTGAVHKSNLCQFGQYWWMTQHHTHLASEHNRKCLSKQIAKGIYSKTTMNLCVSTAYGGYAAFMGLWHCPTQWPRSQQSVWEWTCRHPAARPNTALKAACQSPPCGGSDPAPDRKEAELNAKLPDTHTDTQLTGSWPHGTVTCCAHLSWKNVFTSLLWVSKMI